MLQFLSIDLYNSPALFILFSLTPREQDKECPLYLRPIIDDVMWEIKATGSILTCDSNYESFTVTYDRPIAYLKTRVFTVWVILDDGSYHFKSLQCGYKCVSQEEDYIYRIEDVDDLIDDTLSVYDELINDKRMLELSQITKRQAELVEKQEGLIRELEEFNTILYGS
jgi:hypothetical protein